MTSFGRIDTPVGVLGVLSDGRAVTAVGWRTTAPPEADARPDEVLEAALRQLDEYFAGARRAFDVPIDLGERSEAVRAVLTTLFTTVGYGESLTYGELAARSGTGVPARAIGAVMGANPIPIIVPCHRVLASDGLGGYSGGKHGNGLVTKRWLLEKEGALPAALF
ncbi:methylated-DNA--[protein]-cysteine S-methyltransferase [Microbacterium resistens]